ncbi:MAG: DUF5788 family protein [Methanomassiliicoccales archaeon]|jgi:hypothetical protein
MKSDLDDRISEDERTRILANLRSLTSWVGGMIPEEEEIEGKRIPLRDIVYSYIAEETPTDEEIEGALSLAVVLEKKGWELENLIKTGDIKRSEAHRLEDETKGLLKAADALRHLKGDVMGVKAKALAAKVGDARRWLEFVKKIK